MHNLYKIAPQIVNGFYHLYNPKQCSYYLATNYSIIAQNSFKLPLIGCNVLLYFYWQVFFLIRFSSFHPF